MDDKVYIAIDLKSFYASVECVARGLDPLDTNLVVADKSRTAKTICLAVSPSMKSYGIPGRARLFEVVQKIFDVNRDRRSNIPCRKFSGKSYTASVLKADKTLEADYIIAAPQMALYMRTSSKIYSIYLKYVAPADIFAYSVDEVFIDATAYLKTYKCSAYEFAEMLVRSVLKETGITATAGIGTNLYLCKIAMDIEAKHIAADKDGVRIAYLNEKIYREKLWNYRPLTSFWRVGAGYAKKLEANGMYTMGDIAMTSVHNEELLYKLFGVNAELLIDHAWGYEPCTLSDVKSYKPSAKSISTGQVLQEPYNFFKGRLIVREMADMLALDLVSKELVTNQIVLTVGYDIENLNTPEKLTAYGGSVTTDRYGRKIPKSAHGTVNLDKKTSSSKSIINAVTELYEKIVDKELLVRRMYVVANKVVPEKSREKDISYLQFSLFDGDMGDDPVNKQKEQTEKEKRLQKTVIALKNKFGKNAVLKGMNYCEGATMRERNGQVGGHKA